MARPGKRAAPRKSRAKADCVKHTNRSRQIAPKPVRKSRVPPVKGLARPIGRSLKVEDTRTAFHEAGHAVLQIALGIGCEGATIVSNVKERSAGSSRHGGEYGKDAQAPGESDDDVANLRLYAEDAFLLRHAIADYAGAEALRRWDPARADWRDGADSDYDSAIDRINQITQDAESIKLLFKLARRRCQVLVEYYWPEIGAVASLLLEKRTGSGKQVRATFLRSLNARRGRLVSY